MTSRSRSETPRQRWERQMASLREFRDNLEKDHAGQGQKWVLKMRAYYDRRIETLRAAEPPEENTEL